MDLIEKKIVEAIPANPGTSFDFKGVYVDPEGDSHNVTVFDTEYFTTNVIQLYRNRRMVIDKDQEGYLANLFRIWKSSRENLYLKQAYAYTLKYNPINNYDMLEVMTDDTTTHEKGASFKDDYHNTDTNTLTPFTKEKVEVTPYEVKVETTPYDEKVETTPYEPTVETTPYTKETTTTTENASGSPAASATNSIKAFNSGAWTETSKTDNTINNKQEYQKTGTEKVETTYNGTKETVETTHNNTKETVETSYNNTKEITEKTYTGTQSNTINHTGYIEHTTDGTDTDTRNYQLTRVGNIGVQTVSDMLSKEYENLMQDLAHRALFEFIDRYTWYSEEVG